MGKIVDISYWQGDVKWTESTKGETDYVIIRASCGSAKDMKYAYNAQQAAKLGIPFGAYHYLMCLDEAQARAEADRFYEAVTGGCRQLPTLWALDVEYGKLIWQNGKSLPMNPNLLKITEAFVQRLLERQPGAKVWFYGGESVYNYGHLDKVRWDGLWIANYSGSPGMYCELHQYGQGKWNGKSPVDLNRLVCGATLSTLTGEEGDAEADEPETVDENGDGKIVRCVAEGTWFVRQGNGTGYDAILVAKTGYEWEYIATAVNGWLCVKLDDGRLGWISPKAAEVVEP